MLNLIVDLWQEVAELLVVFFSAKLAMEASGAYVILKERGVIIYETKFLYSLLYVASF